MTMKRTAFQRNVSAYLFAMTLTIIFCLFVTGIVYIDLRAHETILSADGMISPMLNRIIDTATKLFNL